MTTTTHYHKCIRKITNTFLALFNNISLIRYNEDGSELQRIIVPISFADREKWVKRIEGDTELDRKIQITLPRMSVEFVGMSYDPSRKLNTNNKNLNSTEDNLFYQYNPIPYDFNFILTIYTRNIEDGNQILEQIIPYFTPDYTVKIKYVPDMNIIRNVPFILNQITPSIDSQGLFDSEARTVFFTLNFTVKGYIFGGINSANVIKYVDINYHTKNIDELIVQSGPGEFIIGETIYQGINQYFSSITGKVQYWDKNSNSLIIESSIPFQINHPIIGSKSNTSRMLVKYNQNVTITKYQAKVNPFNATKDSNWNIIENYDEKI